MYKYEIGDVVMYGVSGACEVVEIGSLAFAGPDKIYYTLRPVYDGRSTIYVPMSKEDDITRKSISEDVAKKFFDDHESFEGLDVEVTREECDPIIKSGDYLTLARLITSIRNLRKQNKKVHKSLNIQEEKILQDAERVFFSEMAVALGLTMNEVIDEYTAILD